MCGFAGSTSAGPDLLDGFRRQLAHRGPDADGVWLEDGFGLAHTRLAIIDLSEAGRQPMVSGCGRWIIAYNGEIYNYRELRTQVEALGVRLRSSSDTEVLLELVARRGPDALQHLRGMFAFALWDRESRELLLVRDRLGIKPLVYAELPGNGIAFASEIATLLGHPGIRDAIDGEALSEYLACLYVPAPRTIYRSIRKLPPGHFLRWRAGRTTVERYWQPEVTGDRCPTIDEAVEEILPLLRGAVTAHMVSDVPVGCFLSGGIDSSVIAALMAEDARREKAPPPRTFTLTFSEAAYDEREDAALVAQHIGSRHTELSASPGNVAARIGPMLRAFGEPFGNPTALLIDDLARVAREHVKVALVGDGGDEVFAGYPRYAGGVMAQRYRKVPRWIRECLLEPASRLIPESSAGRHTARRIREFASGANQNDAEMYAGWVEYFAPAERAELLDQTMQPSRPIAQIYNAGPVDDPLDAMQSADLRSFLPGNILAYGDAMSMAHALELRLPLLDHKLVEAVGRFSAKLRLAHGTKTLLRAAAARLLPPAVTRRRKRGLNPPMGMWLKNELSGLVSEYLRPPNLEALGINPAPVRRLLDEHRRGGRDHALKIWSLLMLVAWRRT
jgi:asparagine synthase (glutamine-hydrolysing)